MVVIAGPNGAGKTTISRRVIRESVGIVEFVNADVIAAGLSGFAPERAAFAAGRIMLQRLDDLARDGADFAFETTLASRTFAPWLASRMHEGYRVHLIYVWLRSPRLAVQRVQARVRKGGHEVPADIVRRRYARSMHNLFELYQPLASRDGSWRIFDNSDAMPVAVAEQLAPAAPIIHAPDVYDLMRRLAYADQSQEDSNGG